MRDQIELPIENGLISRLRDTEVSDDCGSCLCDVAYIRRMLKYAASILIDFCKTSLFSSSFMCTSCAIDICTVCYADWVRQDSRPVGQLLLFCPD